MPEPLRIPNLRHHKPSGQAVVTLPLPNGKRKDLYLGRWNSRESKAEYARIVGELAVTPVIDAVVNKSTGITVNEILIGFWRYAETYYGKESSERETYRLVIRTVRESYGTRNAQAVLGHSAASMTDHYSRSANDQLAEANAIPSRKQTLDSGRGSISANR
jgi:hypothetical protein